MKKIPLIFAFLFVVSCGPRPTANLHFLSLPETNEANALPLHVVPTDNTLMVRITNLTPEDWFVSDILQTTAGIKKRVFRGAQTEIIKVERRDNKNDFLVIVDYANNDRVDKQRILIGDSYYKDKDIYILVGPDSIRLVDKKIYEDYRRSIR